MATIDTTCPQCGAPHAKKLSLIHQEGFSTVQTDINTVGTFNTVGRQKIKTTGTATGVQQTQASKNAAPPEVPGIVTRGEVIRGVVIIVGIILCVTGFFSDSVTVAILGASAIVFSFGVPVAATGEELANHRQATKHSQAARDAWEKTFKCSSCGHKFVPSEVNAV
jgi:rubredoxin